MRQTSLFLTDAESCFLSLDLGFLVWKMRGGLDSPSPRLPSIAPSGGAIKGAVVHTRPGPLPLSPPCSSQTNRSVLPAGAPLRGWGEWRWRGGPSGISGSEQNSSSHWPWLQALPAQWGPRTPPVAQKRTLGATLGSSFPSAQILSPSPP